MGEPVAGHGVVIRRNSKDLPVSADDGMGLIEIVVCIFLIGILAISFLPLFAQGMQLAARNATIASATQIANEQLEIARGTATSCTAFTGPGGYGASTPPVMSDARGSNYQATRSVSACPATYPGVVQVTVSVSKVGAAGVLSSATTYVRLTAAT